MDDRAPQVNLPPPALSPDKAAERLREAKAILAAAGFPGAGVGEHEHTLLIEIDPGDLARLQDEAFREGLVVRLKSLGYAFIALDVTPDDAGASPADPHGVAGSALA